MSKPKPYVSEHGQAVNAFIPQAEREAAAKVAVLAKRYRRCKTVGWDGIEYDWKWDFYCEYFHAAMDQLTWQAGLRVLSNKRIREVMQCDDRKAEGPVAP